MIVDWFVALKLVRGVLFGFVWFCLVLFGFLFSSRRSLDLRDL